ncbi:MAG: redox-sensing transcriptional repressor Rex [Anaerolineaceae bacterium]
MEKNTIPDKVITRLPIYLQVLNQLLRDGREIVSSQELAEQLGVSATQIRKDLSYFGGFGKQGSGYDIIRLVDELREILNLDKIWQVALVGVGNLGQALLSYQGFSRKGFEIVLAFDNNPKIIDSTMAGIKISDVKDLETQVQREKVAIGIITVPASTAQPVAERMVKSGIKAILNYAPVTLKVSPDVRVLDIDPVLKLQNLTYYL